MCIRDRYRAIQNSGKEITISSNDGEADALAYTESGEYLLENLVGNGRLGYWGMVIADRLSKGEEMAKDQYLPTYKVPGEKMKPVVEEAGLEKGEDGTQYQIVTCLLYTSLLQIPERRHHRLLKRLRSLWTRR